MAVYSAPEGFVSDPSTGLYVRESILTDDAGVKYRHRMYFNADTGEYTQFSEPIAKPVQPMPVQQQNAAYKAKPVKRKKHIVLKTLLVAVPVITVIAAVLMVISYKQGYPNDVPDLTEDEISDIISELQLDTVPEMTVEMQEYNGTIREEGIIR